MATVRTGGGVIHTAVIVLVVLLVAPHIVNGFLAWLVPLLPLLGGIALGIVALLGLGSFFIRRARRNAAR